MQSISRKKKSSNLIRYLSKSERVRFLERKKFYKFILINFIVILLTLIVITMYTPCLHLIYGDAMRWAPDKTWQGFTAKFFEDNWAALINNLVVKEPLPDDQSPLPTIRLLVTKNAFDKLNKEILAYYKGEIPSKTRVNGFIKNADRRIDKVRVGYRGTNNWHHQPWKPSLQIKYPRSKIRLRHRKHSLIAPEDGIAIRNWFSIELARRWGMLNYDEQFVRLFINGKYKGVYTRVWKFNESLLITNNKLPGPFFRLESQTGPVFKRRDASFFNPSTWEIRGADRATGESYLQTLVDTVKTEDPLKRIKLIDELFDKEQMAKYLAVLAHSGEVHVGIHNIAIWLDTTSGKFVPLLIDINGYDSTHPGKNLKRPILKRYPVFIWNWLQHPENLALYIDYLHELWTTIGSVEASTKLITDTWHLIRRDMMADMYVSNIGAGNQTAMRTLMPLTSLDADVKKMTTFIEQRKDYTFNIIYSDQVFLTDKTDEHFEVLVIGFAGAYVTRKNGKSFLFYGKRIKRARLLPTAASVFLYPYAFYTLPGKANDYNFSQRLNHRQLEITDFPYATKGRNYIKKLKNDQGIHPHSLIKAMPKSIKIGPGRVLFTKDTVFSQNETVTIQPNTQIELDPGVSLIFKGKLIANGTEASPITVRPSTGQPFGVFAIIGKEATGSQINYFEIEGGSVERILNLVLSGMLSIHDNDDIRISHLRVGKNKIGDDAFHVVRSKIELKNSVFKDSYLDAVDFDQVTGTVKNVDFKDCGNDCLDLSMSRLMVENSQCENCQDKCFSIGEGSKVQLNISNIKNGDIGVAVKDTSETILNNVVFKKCHNAVSAYNKKWRWEKGGKVWLDGVQFFNSNNADIQYDKKSEFFFVDKNYDGQKLQSLDDRVIRRKLFSHKPDWDFK